MYTIIRSTSDNKYFTSVLKWLVPKIELHDKLKYETSF